MIAVYTCLTQQHDLRLVALAGLVCLVSTTIGVDLLARAKQRRGTPYARLALACGAVIVGSTGVWATHFLAILAYDVGLQIAYLRAFGLFLARQDFAWNHVGPASAPAAQPARQVRLAA